jgi:hypothetical protein
MDDTAEQFERDYAAGRRAGLRDAIEFIWAIVDKLPATAEARHLINETVIDPLYAEVKRRHLEQS